MQLRQVHPGFIQRKQRIDYLFTFLGSLKERMLRNRLSHQNGGIPFKNNSEVWKNRSPLEERTKFA